MIIDFDKLNFSDDDDNDGDNNENEFSPPGDEENLTYEEIKHRGEILQGLVYQKDRIINSQLSHIGMLEAENRNLQNQYTIIYNAFVGLSTKAKEMLKREKAIKFFLKKKKFDLHDVDEFINELKIDHYYKRKNEQKNNDIE